MVVYFDFFDIVGGKVVLDVCYVNVNVFVFLFYFCIFFVYCVVGVFVFFDGVKFFGVWYYFVGGNCLCIVWFVDGWKVE